MKFNIFLYLLRHNRKHSSINSSCDLSPKLITNVIVSNYSFKKVQISFMFITFSNLKSLSDLTLDLIIYCGSKYITVSQFLKILRTAISI